MQSLIALKDPIAPGIRERCFVSPHDKTIQTYLEKDFCGELQSPPSVAVLYLHGAASHQEQGMTSGIYGGAFDTWAEDLARRQAVYICPEYRGASWMGPVAEIDLREILDLVRRQYAPKKTILVGGSMGGTSALIFASRFPQEIDAVIALCPATDVIQMFPSFSEQFASSYGGSPTNIPHVYAERCSRNFTDVLSTLPLLVVHGSRDEVIDVEHSRVLARRLEEKNATFRYIEMEGGDHDAPLNFSFSAAMDFILHADTVKT